MGAHNGPEEQRSSRHRQQQTSSIGMCVLFPLSRLLPGRPPPRVAPPSPGSPSIMSPLPAWILCPFLIPSRTEGR